MKRTFINIARDEHLQNISVHRGGPVAECKLCGYDRALDGVCQWCTHRGESPYAQDEPQGVATAETTSGLPLDSGSHPGAANAAEKASGEATTLHQQAINWLDQSERCVEHVRHMIETKIEEHYFSHPKAERERPSPPVRDRLNELTVDLKVVRRCSVVELRRFCDLYLK